MFEEAKHPRSHGKFTDGQTVGEHVAAHGRGALPALAAAHGSGALAFEAPGRFARQMREAKQWLEGQHARDAIEKFAKNLALHARDPEVVKGVLGTAVNTAIGHYVYTHDNIDYDIVAHAIQHVQIGLAVSAHQARGILSGAVDALGEATHAATRTVQASVKALGRILAGAGSAVRVASSKIKGLVTSDHHIRVVNRGVLDSG